MIGRPVRTVVAVTGLLLVAACSGGDPAASSSPESSSTPNPSSQTWSPGTAVPSKAPSTAPSKPPSAPPKSTTPGKRATPRPTAVGNGTIPVIPNKPPKTTKRWAPARGTAWQWQLSGSLNLSVNAPVYDVDGVDTSAAQVAELHKRGRRVICYVDVGTYEKGRPDSGRFPASVRGKGVEGWPGEQWLDIRRRNVLGPIMAARFDQCRAKGFDAVEPDNVDGYANDSGFPLTAADQLSYNRWIAGLAHSRGMSVGLKNDLGQVSQLVSAFDFAVNEQCAQFNECEALVPFIRAGKAVLHVEYELGTGAFCAETRKYGFSSMRKPEDLGAAREPC